MGQRDDATNRVIGIFLTALPDHKMTTPIKMVNIPCCKPITASAPAKISFVVPFASVHRKVTCSHGGLFIGTQGMDSTPPRR